MRIISRNTKLSASVYRIYSSDVKYRREIQHAAVSTRQAFAPQKASYFLQKVHSPCDYSASSVSSRQLTQARARARCNNNFALRHYHVINANCAALRATCLFHCSATFVIPATERHLRVPEKRERERERGREKEKEREKKKKRHNTQSVYDQCGVLMSRKTSTLY